MAWKNGIAFASDAPLGQYYEFGIGPECTFAEKATYPVTLNLSDLRRLWQQWFLRSGIGYFSTGAELIMPLAFIPESLGSWSTSVSARYYRLGSTSAFYTNSGDPDQGVFAWSMGAEF